MTDHFRISGPAVISFSGGRTSAYMLHRALKSTIAAPGDLGFGPRAVMACHESDDAHCIGWLVNQLGPGNNIGLRILMMSCENARAIKLRGEQHETFEDTLP